MNVLDKIFECRDSLLGIETVQSNVFIGYVVWLSCGNPHRIAPRMRQPLRFSQVGLASPQLGCLLSHFHLKTVSGFAKLFFGPRALVEEARVLKRCGGLIGGQT
jgi:hypothetical protein